MNGVGDLGLTDEDIGMCDECGTTDGSRFWTVVLRTVDGKRVRVWTWLCDECLQIEQAKK